jgi:hypothetical protein
MMAQRTIVQLIDDLDGNEPVGVTEVGELADDVQAGLFLAVDEVAVEQVYEGVPPAGVQCVLAQFDDGAAAVVHASSSVADGSLAARIDVASAVRW